MGKFIIGPFVFLGVPRTIYFGCLSLYFDNFLARKTVGSRETLRAGLFFSFIFFNRKKSFREKNPCFALMTHLMSPLSPHLHKFWNSKNGGFIYFFHLFWRNTVNIVEVWNFGFLPFSKLPGFHRKWSKIGHFGPQMAQNLDLSKFLPNYILIFRNLVFQVISRYSWA